ncbi:hypothetical protein CHCC15087_3793 [Bacillus licheniformis]|nr:hypothetical protein CHCC15087_3793 [Bacillus licheniformis]
MQIRGSRLSNPIWTIGDPPAFSCPGTPPRATAERDLAAARGDR